MASDDRPAEAVMCLIPSADLELLRPIGERKADTDDGSDRPEAPPSGCPITAAVISSNGDWVGQWEYLAPRCPRPGEPTVPKIWLADEVGPYLGYSLAEPDAETSSEDDGSSDGE